MHTPRIKVLLVMVLATGTSTPFACWSQSRAPLMQSLDIQMPVAPTPVQIGGQPHLVYELHVTNFRSHDIVLTRVVAFDPDTKITLSTLLDSELTSKIGHPAMRTEPADKRVIAGGMRAVIFQWIAFDDARRLPAKVQHRIEFDLSSGPAHSSVQDSPTLVSINAPVVLSPPLRGGPWVAVYDPQLEHGHRTSIYTIEGRARIPARFAIDWMRMNEDSSLARGDESSITNWHGYGADVLAVADGVIVEAKDDMTEPVSLAAAHGEMSLENASGNYVTLNLGKGRYAFYEHLKHGSIKVRVGERVRAGQLIGQLGNSGSSSSGPHLHFHVADANSTLAAEGMPFVFDAFDVIGVFPTLEAVINKERWQPPPANLRGTRKMEMPAGKTVVMFP